MKSFAKAILRSTPICSSNCLSKKRELTRPESLRFFVHPGSVSRSTTSGVVGVDVRFAFFNKKSNGCGSWSGIRRHLKRRNGMRRQQSTADPHLLGPIENRSMIFLAPNALQKLRQTTNGAWNERRRRSSPTLLDL